MVRPRTALVLALLALASLAACGGDGDKAEAPLDPPAPTIPRTAPDPARTEPTHTTTSTGPDATTGEDPATAPLAPGEGDGTGAPPEQTAPDGPRNDTPPPAGSPAERFERECAEKPAACG